MLLLPRAGEARVRPASIPCQLRRSLTPVSRRPKSEEENMEIVSGRQRMCAAIKARVAPLTYLSSSRDQEKWRSQNPPLRRGWPPLKRTATNEEPTPRMTRRKISRSMMKGYWKSRVRHLTSMLHKLGFRHCEGRILTCPHQLVVWRVQRPPRGDVTLPSRLEVSQELYSPR